MFWKFLKLKSESEFSILPQCDYGCGMHMILEKAQKFKHSNSRSLDLFLRLSDSNFNVPMCEIMRNLKVVVETTISIVLSQLIG